MWQLMNECCVWCKMIMKDQILYTCYHNEDACLYVQCRVTCYADDNVTD